MAVWVGAPDRRWFPYFDARKGMRWLERNGFRGGPDGGYRLPLAKDHDRAEVAELLENAFKHGFGLRSSFTLDGSTRLPGVLPGVPLPEPGAADEEHLAAAMVGIIRAGSGSVEASIEPAVRRMLSELHGRGPLFVQVSDEEPWNVRLARSPIARGISALSPDE